MITLNLINVLLLVAYAIGIGVLIGMLIREKQLNNYHDKHYESLLKEYNSLLVSWEKNSDSLSVYKFIEWRRKDNINLSYEEAREYLKSIDGIRGK